MASAAPRNMRIVLPKTPTQHGSGAVGSRVELTMGMPRESRPALSPTAGVFMRLQAAGAFRNGDQYFGQMSRGIRYFSSPAASCESCSSSNAETASSTSGSSARIGPELPSTSVEEKGRIFRGYLTVILSCVYAVFLVTLGFVVYISDLVLGDTHMAEMFSIYLVVLGLAWFVFLYADIRRYLNSRKAQDNIAARHRRNDSVHKDDPEDTDNRVQWNRNVVSSSFIPYYCFNQGRHSGSFYLKIGAAGFCFGHLIHSGLLLGYQVTFLSSPDPNVYQCASFPTLILDILYPTYSFLQLFFIFKYSNVIINHCTELARFALMHCIASSLCFWVWTILRETVDSLSHLHHQRATSSASRSNLSLLHEMSEALHTITPLPLELQETHHHDEGPRDLVGLLNDSTLLIDNCRGSSKLSDNLENFSPYLYPFTIEYSILVVGVLFIIWQNIGRCRGPASLCWSAPQCRQLPSSYEAGFTSNVVLHADCHNANKGLFAGMIVLVGSAVSIILFFVAMADRAFVTTGLMVNAVTELTLLVLMTISVAIAYRQMTKLDINKHAVSLLDDLLLFLCIPAFFLYAIFSIMPAVQSQNYLSITTIILQVVQVLLQTPFIIDGLRRCSNSRNLRFQKPGRELVTFLVVCNVAMWIIETFEIKSQDVRDDRYQFYGSVLWTMLSHMTLPLTMFYRFHSSVCLVDIWKSAYEPGDEQ